MRLPSSLSRVALAAAMASALAFGAASPALAASTDYYLKLGGVEGETKASAAGEKWLVADSFSFGVERAMKESGEKGGTADINIGVGELQEMTISKSMDKSTPKLLEPAIKGKVFKGQASKSPRPKGSLTLLVPAGKCRVGARYPTAEFGTPGRVYRMQSITVAACSPAAASGGDVAMESIALNYEGIR